MSGLHGLAVKAMASQSKGREFMSRCGQEEFFSFCKSRFRSLQPWEAHANEINHDIHLANTLFQKKVFRKIWLPSEYYITVHVSFKWPHVTPRDNKMNNFSWILWHVSYITTTIWTHPHPGDWPQMPFVRVRCSNITVYYHIIIT